MNPKKLHWFIISTFVSLYVVVSVISTIHVIEFFKLSNPEWLAIFLAIAFEIGAAASLASIITLEKMNKNLIWLLFFVLTFMQGMGNTYYAFVNLENFESWSQLFGLEGEEQIFQKRVLSLISGAILPLVALGFIKSLVDYIKPSEEDSKKIDEDQKEIIIDGGDISIEGPDLTPTPTSTPSETPEITPTPSETPEITPTPSETPEITPIPSETPEIIPTFIDSKKLPSRRTPQVDPTLL